MNVVKNKETKNMMDTIGKPMRREPLSIVLKVPVDETAFTVKVFHLSELQRVDT